MGPGAPGPAAGLRRRSASALTAPPAACTARVRTRGWAAGGRRPATNERAILIRMWTCGLVRSGTVQTTPPPPPKEANLGIDGLPGGARERPAASHTTAKKQKASENDKALEGKGRRPLARRGARAPAAGPHGRRGTAATGRRGGRRLGPYEWACLQGRRPGCSACLPACRRPAGRASGRRVRQSTVREEAARQRAPAAPKAAAAGAARALGPPPALAARRVAAAASENGSRFRGRGGARNPRPPEAPGARSDARPGGANFGGRAPRALVPARARRASG